MAGGSAHTPLLENLAGSVEHVAMILFGWRATIATSQCRQRALGLFYREIACQEKTRHALDNAVSCPRPLIRQT